MFLLIVFRLRGSVTTYCSVLNCASLNAIVLRPPFRVVVAAPAKACGFPALVANGPEAASVELCPRRSRCTRLGKVRSHAMGGQTAGTVSRHNCLERSQAARGARDDNHDGR